MGGPGVDMKRFLLLSAAAPEQGIAISRDAPLSSLWLNLSDRFLREETGNESSHQKTIRNCLVRVNAIKQFSVRNAAY